VNVLRGKFKVLCEQGVDEQLEFFLKSFIFALDEGWKEVNVLRAKFGKYLRDLGTQSKNLNFIQTTDFLQKNDKARIQAQDIQKELSDIDLDKNNEISFIEYLCLHYKVMILVEYYKRTKEKPTEDLSIELDGRGITGVGDKILKELFAPKAGLSPELIKAIEAFSAKKKELEAKRQALEATVASGGVKGNVAANELAQLDASDKTTMNREEVTLDAARRKALKFGGDVELEKKKKLEEEERKRAEDEARQRMADRRKAFEQPNPVKAKLTTEKPKLKPVKK